MIDCVLPHMIFISLPQVDESLNNDLRRIKRYGSRSEHWDLKGVCNPPSKKGRHPFNILTEKTYD